MSNKLKQNLKIQQVHSLHCRQNCFQGLEGSCVLHLSSITCVRSIGKTGILMSEIFYVFSSFFHLWELVFRSGWWMLFKFCVFLHFFCICVFVSSKFTCLCLDLVGSGKSALACGKRKVGRSWGSGLCFHLLINQPSFILARLCCSLIHISLLVMYNSFVVIQSPAYSMIQAIIILTH